MLEEALACINKVRFAKCNYSWKLFELGKEIPLTTEKAVVEQPAIVTTKIIIDK